MYYSYCNTLIGTGRAYQNRHGSLTLSSYESGVTVKAYIETVAVGETLPAMPLFLEPGGHVLLPVDATYEAAFAAVPRRWKQVLELVDET
jgi:hypothetical protein